MNVFKRWTTSIASSFDYVINQVENHDALVTAAIREMQSSGAKAIANRCNGRTRYRNPVTHRYSVRRVLCNDPE